MTKPFTLISAKVRDAAIAAVRCAPIGWQVLIKEPKRGTDQNAVLWGLLDDFAEQVTLLASTRVPDASVRAVVSAFGKEGAAALLSLIVAINTWNTIGVTTRCWPTAVRRHD